MTGSTLVPRFEASDRSRTVALVLNGLLGVFGAHRFYVGKTGTGTLMLLTLGGCGLWWLYDLVLILGGEFRDADDRRITDWSPSDAAAAGDVPSRELERVLDELDHLRQEMTELHERVDFAERLLSKGSSRGVRGDG